MAPSWPPEAPLPKGCGWVRIVVPERWRRTAGRLPCSNNGSVAQLDRALASGARGRAFESRRAHSGRSSPVDTSVSRGSSSLPIAPPPVTFPVTNPRRWRRSPNCSRCCPTRYSTTSERCRVAPRFASPSHPTGGQPHVPPCRSRQGRRPWCPRLPFRRHHVPPPKPMYGVPVRPLTSRQ